MAYDEWINYLLSVYADADDADKVRIELPDDAGSLTTLTLLQATKQRFDCLKPFDSLTAGEWVNCLLDVYLAESPDPIPYRA